MHFILFLRGINVSGKRIIPMRELAALLENKGFRHVKTYIQSGNIALESDLLPEEIKQITESAIQEQFGFEVPAWVLTREELQYIVDQNPFQSPEYSPEFLHLTLLDREPDDFSPLERVKKGSESYRLGTRVVYLFCPEGYGNIQLTNTVIEKKLKCPATTRNLKTINYMISTPN